MQICDKAPWRPRLPRGALPAFDPIDPFESAHMEPHLRGREAWAHGAGAPLRGEALPLRARVPCTPRHRRRLPGLERNAGAAPAAHRVPVIVGSPPLVFAPPAIAPGQPPPGGGVLRAGLGCTAPLSPRQPLSPPGLSRAHHNRWAGWAPLNPGSRGRPTRVRANLRQRGSRHGGVRSCRLGGRPPDPPEAGQGMTARHVARRGGRTLAFEPNFTLLQ
jgi:hypothetical protein